MRGQPLLSPVIHREKMAAAPVMMPYFGQQISSKSDLVPDWTRQEVSTGVSTWSVVLGRTEPGPVRSRWSVFKRQVAAEWDSSSAAANSG